MGARFKEAALAQGVGPVQTNSGLSRRLRSVLAGLRRLEQRELGRRVEVVAQAGDVCPQLPGAARVKGERHGDRVAERLNISAAKATIDRKVVRHLFSLRRFRGYDEKVGIS